MGDVSRLHVNAVRLRSLRSARVFGTLLVGAVCSGLLIWVAPPGAVIDQLSDVDPAWLLAAVGLELASCASYLVLFRRFFPEPPRAVSRRVAWMAMGAGAVLPGGNISSAAATGWLLRDHGIGSRRLLGRCGAMLVLLTAIGFVLNGISGAVLLAGVPGGPHDLLRAGGPVLVSVLVLSGGVLLARLSRRVGPRSPRLLREAADGLSAAWPVASHPHWRLLGAVGFLGFDMAALWAAAAATGHMLGPPALIVAYCIGYLATMIPMPAGLGVLDSGLAAVLVLYGLPATASVSAVLLYHAIAIWVPGLGGVAAWLPVRRRATVPSAASTAPAAAMAPAVSVVPPRAPLSRLPAEL